MTNEELDKLFGSFCLEGKISGKHAMEIKEILKSNSRNIFAAPMGVSQWREHGKTYKYWSYFRNEVIDECIKAIGTFAPTCGYESEEEKGYQNGLIAEENLIKKQLRRLKSK